MNLYFEDFIKHGLCLGLKNINRAVTLIQIRIRPAGIRWTGRPEF